MGLESYGGLEGYSMSEPGTGPGQVRDRFGVGLGQVRGGSRSFHNGSGPWWVWNRSWSGLAGAGPEWVCDRFVADP